MNEISLTAATMLMCLAQGHPSHRYNTTNLYDYILAFSTENSVDILVSKSENLTILLNQSVYRKALLLRKTFGM